MVGNAPNLHETPPAWFDYPSFGMNTIYKYEGWKPAYYVAVDTRLMNEGGAIIAERFGDIPKFIPTPNLDAWQGENFYRFLHRPGDLYPATSPDSMTVTGISYGNVMHVAMQLALWMGFTTLLMIGVEHDPQELREHFWGIDERMSATPPMKQWLDGYAEIVQHASQQATILNISHATHVPAHILPRGDWRDWRNDEN